MRTIRPSCNAFSLVELSIVLVILGLLVGGVLSGQSLIRAAELRSVTASYNNYATAVRAFQDKYFALPGDIANITQFWGSAGGTGADTACYTAQTAAAINTCNGNGDGAIRDSAFTFSERFTVWKHLSNAGLIEGNYTGVSAGAPGSYTVVPGSNAPAAKLANGYFDIVYVLNAPAFNFAGSIFNVNVVAIYGTSSSFGILKPEEAWNIDTKMDDGNPVYGKAFATKKTGSVGTDCTTSDADSATYDFTQTGRNCVLRIAL